MARFSERFCSCPSKYCVMHGNFSGWERFKVEPKEREVPSASALDPSAQVETGKVAHKSGATSSHFSPYSFRPTWEGMKLTSLRYDHGNVKHEHGDPLYSTANWLKAFRERDVKFFRDRAGHAVEHIIHEMRGKDDPDPGGNLGGVGWWQDMMAFVKVNDPFLYGAIQGKWRIDDHNVEESLNKQPGDVDGK